MTTWKNYARIVFMTLVACVVMSACIQSGMSDTTLSSGSTVSNVSTTSGLEDKPVTNVSNH